MFQRSYGIIQDEELKTEIINKLKTLNVPNINEKSREETRDFLINSKTTDDLSTLKYDIQSLVVTLGRPVFSIINNSFSTAAADEHFSEV